MDFLRKWWFDDSGFCPEPIEKSRDTRLHRLERGQSLVEYCILLTWTCLAMMAMINAAATNTKRIWTTANQDLSQANITAS